MSNRRVVLVTGSSSGIGLATSLAFARAGDTVIATMRDPRRSAQLIAAANSARLAVQVRALDVTSDASVEAAFSSVVGEYGQVDVVVNNAGIGIPGTLEDLEMADIMRSLEVNFLGVARVTKAALPIMRKLGGGRIIAVSSTAGLVGTPFNDAYCAAKHALEGLFESLQPVAASLGVYVTLVEPGPTATGFYDPSKIPVSADPAIAALQVRLRRIVEPMMARGQPAEEVADVIVEVAGRDEPRLRYQSSRLAVRLIEGKIADLDGETVTSASRRLFAPTNP